MDDVLSQTRGRRAKGRVHQAIRLRFLVLNTKPRALGTLDCYRRALIKLVATTVGVSPKINQSIVHINVQTLLAASNPYRPLLDIRDAIPSSRQPGANNGSSLNTSGSAPFTNEVPPNALFAAAAASPAPVNVSRWLRCWSSSPDPAALRGRETASPSGSPGWPCTNGRCRWVLGV